MESVRGVMSLRFASLDIQLFAIVASDCLLHRTLKYLFH
jgi:hypothetical protein